MQINSIIHSVNKNINHGIKFCILACLLLIGAGAHAEAVYNEDNTTIPVTLQHPQFTIRLKSNPTTGYSWVVRDYSDKLLTLIKHDFAASSTKLIGAPGYESWTFRANPQAFSVPQVILIRMVYARPWKSADAGTQVIFRVMTGK